MYQTSSRKRTKNPREGAGFFSVLTFFYAIDIFKKAKRKELEEEDVYEVTKACRSHDLGDKLQKEWVEEQKKKRHVSLTKTLFRVFGAEFMLYGIVNLVFSISITIVRPWAMGKLVSYFDDPSMPKLVAVSYASLVTLCGIVDSFFSQYYYYSLTYLSLKLRAALCSLMYRKCLKLTSSSLAEVTNGKIVTLMTKDAEVFDMVLWVIHGVWIGVLQLFVVTVLMYRTIGASAFVGIFFLVAMMPPQAWIAVQSKKMRLKTSAKTDERLRRIQEILTSIKLVKLYVWEKYYTKVVNKLRCEEMKKLRAMFYLKAIILGIGAMSYRVSFFLCLITYALSGNVLNAEKAFYLISCYGSVSHVINIYIPWSVSQIADAKSALIRIKGFLLVEERVMESNVGTAGKVLVSDGESRINEEIILRNIDLNVSGATLVGITGGIGSGKSSLLKMILQDINISGGKVLVSGKIGYASQEPWLFPGTIRQNILFGNTYNEKRYETVLYVCALTKDLNSFSKRDMTIVNDKGLNLSKGQQARINLARTIYNDCEVYLLDDVMSSLDGNVSSHVFDHCIKEFLRDKLCFLVCHSEKCLEQTDTIIVLQEGVVKAQGTYKQLKAEDIKFENTVKVEVNISDDEVEEDAENNQEESDLLMQSRTGSIANVYGEIKRKGKVDRSVYKKYFSLTGGWLIFVVVAAICMASQIVGVGFDYYITKWLEVQKNSTTVPIKTNDTKIITIDSRAVYTYSTLIVVYITFLLLDLFSFFTMVLRAARLLHIYVFERIMKATMSFFDAHLSGNVLNRFSRDVFFIDEYLGFMLYDCIKMLFWFVCSLGAVGYVKPILIAPATGFFLIIIYTAKEFMQSSRSLRRMEASTKAPVIGYLNSSLEGLTTIRAAGNQNILEKQFDSHQDLNNSTVLMTISSQKAYNLWTELIANFYNFLIILTFFVYSSAFVKSGDIGFVISQMFALSGSLQWTIRQLTGLENIMTSVERFLEFADVEQEDVTGGAPKNWPINGNIEFKVVGLRYPMSKKPVLQGVNFSIKSGEKIGVVGRTGAGKSSIFAVLFRLYKYDGSILIDGFDINDIELPMVRSKISVIPQEPVMFKGTVRTNLDPYERHTDLELWNALEDVGLKKTVESLGLSSEVDEGGSNWSIGQRQLFCLGRAVLLNNKIVVLDEATANIDPSTDAFIQTAIKRIFKNCTILTIAHRINTVINSEKIMVIDNGAVVEFDTPQNLLNRGHGAFYTVAREAGLVD